MIRHLRPRELPPHACLFHLYPRYSERHWPSLPLPLPPLPLAQRGRKGRKVHRVSATPIVLCGHCDRSAADAIHPSLAATLVHRRSDLRWWIHPFQIILPRHLRHPLPQFLLQIQNRQERGERRVHLACPIRIPAFSR